MPDPQHLLVELRDIHLPLPIEQALTQIPTSAFVVIGLVGVSALIYWIRYRHLRTMLLTLAQLAQRHDRNGDAIELVQGLTMLLRRQAMRCFPASPVASLVDNEWLDFLDAHGGGGQFRHGPGVALASLPYQMTVDETVDGAALLALVGCWLRANPG